MTFNAVLKSPAFFFRAENPWVSELSGPKTAGAEVGRQGWGDELSGHGVGKPLA